MTEKINNIKNKASESDLLDIFSSALECISRIDKQGHYLSVNQQYAEVCGYQPEEMIGLSWHKTVHSDDLQKAKQAYQDMLEKGRSDIELRGIRKNKTTFYKHIVIVKGIEDENSLISHYCFMQDVTERKLSEENEFINNNLKSENEKLNNFLSLIPAVSFRVDVERKKIIEISDNITKLTGYSSDEVCETINFKKLIVEEDFKEVSTKINKAIQIKEPYDVSYRINTKSDEFISIKEQGIPVVVAEEVKFIDGFLTEISSHSKNNQPVKKLTNQFYENPSDHYFKDVVRKLSEVANVKVAAVTECIDFTESSVRTLALYNGSDYVDSMEYELVETPCQKVVEGEPCFYPEKVQKMFPNDSDLVDLNAESYCAVPLFNSQKEVIGHIFIIDDKPLEGEEKYISILNNFALPVAKELERQREDAVFNEIASAFNNIYGEEFFNNLAIYLQKILKADYVLIGELNNAEPCEVKTLALCHQGELLENMNYFLEGSPCQSVLNARVKSCPVNVQEFYPDNKWLHDIQAQSYIGAPLLDKKGNPKGVISVINTLPIKNINTYESIVNIFAVRAADELNRNRYEQVLKTYKDIVNSSSDFISMVSLDYKYLSVNKVYLSFFGKTNEDIIGLPVVNLHGEDNFYYKIKPLLDRCFKGERVESELVITDNNKNKIHIHSIHNPYYSNNGEIMGAVVVARDISERKSTELLLELESKCYQIESNIDDFEQSMTHIINEIETYSERLIGSIAILDESGKSIINTIAPKLSKDYLNAIEGLSIGEGIGSCGTAAFREELVVVSDIQNDDLWKDYRDLAAKHDLAACWSIPIKSSRQKVIGTFACYYQQPQSPSSFELLFINRVAKIIGNIVEQKINDEKLKVSREKLRRLYNDTPSMFFSLDQEGIIISVNQFGARHLGYDVDELVGENVRTIIHQDDMDKASYKLKECFLNPGAMYRWEVKKLHKDGSEIWVRETANVVNTLNNQEVFIVCEDISENYRLSQKLEYQASHDALTGLINRREFENRLNRVIQEESIRIPGHALCYMDLDNFKVINDTCGHLAGDAMLKQLSELLNTSVRSRDTLARLGGDEFGILMENCSLKQAQSVALKILSIVDEYRFIWDENKFTVGVSIGLVPIDEASGNVTDILSAADNACYAAKDSGRNRVHVFSPNDDELEKRRGEMQWVARINQALEENLFCLFYQDVIPVNSPATHENRRFELLVRIKTYDGGYIMPGAFLPAAERYNLSTKVDQWVIKSALNWLSTHITVLEQVESCAINVSGHSLGNESFLEFCIDKINESKVPANKLCFEITETAAISNLASAREFISELKSKGCTFALDDFGSGLSSFGYLKNLPVDYIKIDGAFIRDITDDPFDHEMVTAINRLGHVMNKKTIAEFVENDQILKILNEIGVDFAQGYGIAKPKPIELFMSEKE